MNALCNHEAYAVSHFNDKTAWLALIDHHEEALEVPHEIAVRAVVAIRRHARRQRELAEAARHLRAEAPFSRRLRWAIRSWFAEDWVGIAYIIAKEGHQRPKLHLPNPVTDGTPHGGSWISVGASYVLELVRRLKEVDSDGTAFRDFAPPHPDVH